MRWFLCQRSTLALRYTLRERRREGTRERNGERRKMEPEQARKSQRKRGGGWVLYFYNRKTREELRLLHKTFSEMLFLKTKRDMVLDGDGDMVIKMISERSMCRLIEREREGEGAR